MTIKITTSKKYGYWQFNIAAGEGMDLDDYASSECEYDTEYDAENAAILWLIYERELIE